MRYARFGWTASGRLSMFALSARLYISTVPQHAPISSIEQEQTIGDVRDGAASFAAVI